MGVTKFKLAEVSWIRHTIEGDSPVLESFESPEGYLSRLEHVKLRLNLRRPFRKAKYSLMTDSELSSANER